MCTDCDECFDTSNIVIPVGPPGTNGTNGTNGTDGTNGTNGTNGADGNSGFTAFVDLAPDFVCIGTEALITGATVTIAVAGNYQIHVSSKVALRVGTPTAATIMSLYLDAVQIQQKDLIDTTSTTGTNTIVHPNFVWRGAVTAGQVLEIRGILGTGSAAAIVGEVSILVNKEA